MSRSSLLPLLGALLLVCVGCDATYHARVGDGAGLAEGSPVLVSGVPVGEVRGLQVVEGQVDVEFTISSDHEITVRDDSCVYVAVERDAAPSLVLRPGVGAAVETEQPIPECEPELPEVGEFLETLGEGMGQLMRQFGQGLFGGGGPSPPVQSSPLPPPPSPAPSRPSTGPSPTPTPPGQPPTAPGQPPSPGPSVVPIHDATSSGPCRDLDVRVASELETVAPVPVILPEGGRRARLTFHNRGPEVVSLGSVGDAVFVTVGDDPASPRRTVRATPMPGDENAWFMPFDVAPDSDREVTVVFAGDSSPHIDELEVRRVTTAGMRDVCTFRASGLSPR